MHASRKEKTMEYKNLGNIVEEIDNSLQKQIQLITLQVDELKKQISSIEELILKIKNTQ